MPICPLCRLHRSGRSSVGNLCKGCKSDLPWNLTYCYQCSLPLPNDAAGEFSPAPPRCGQCLTNTRAFDRTLCPLIYKFPVNRLIASFKFDNNPAMGKLLGALTVKTIINAYSGNNLPQLIIPVPLHPTRQRKRGYNQALLLANNLGQNLKIPVTSKIIKKIKPTVPQNSLSAEERKQNLRDVFTINTRLLVDKKPIRKIAIVDDVITTSTTVTQIANLLKPFGISEIDVWAIARTPEN